MFPVKSLKISFVLGLVAMTLVMARGDDSEAVKKDLAQLQGEWSMVLGSADGQPMPEEMHKRMKRVCKGDEATTMMGTNIFLKARITLDPAKKPKAIAYEMTGGVTKGKKQLGVYEVDGDTFKACFAKPGEPRPTDFSSKPGDGRTSSVWKREKASAPAMERK